MDLDYFDGEARKRQRRNLVLICAWMILFLIGGIGFRETGYESITPIFPFAIKNKNIVEGGMWVLLLYFWLRYYQHYKHALMKFTEELNRTIVATDIIRNIAIEAARKQLPHHDNKAVVHSCKRPPFRRVMVFYERATHPSQTDVFHEVKLPLWPTILYELIVKLRVSFSDAEFLEYIFPHILAATTIIIGAIVYSM